MSATETVLLRELVPLLFNDGVVYDKNGNVVKIIRGIPLHKLSRLFKKKDDFFYLLFLLQKKIDPFQLQIYQHEDQYFLTALSRKKLVSSLTEVQAFILGVFLTLRKMAKKPIQWSILEKELTDEMIKINNPRKQVESLVNQGLIYKKNLNPLIFECGPKLFLEFDKESLDFIIELMQEQSLLSITLPSREEND